jgi:Ran GTPase-activating protein (RanGAP) involved in mRNA processing and transport
MGSQYDITKAVSPHCKKESLSNYKKVISGLSTNFHYVLRCMQNHFCHHNLCRYHTITSYEEIYETMEKITSKNEKNRENAMKIIKNSHYINLNQPFNYSTYTYNEKFIQIANALSVLTNVHSIHLSSNNIGKNGMIHLTRTLATNTTIHTLDLSYSTVYDDETSNSIIEMLRMNTTIHTIDLSSMRMNLGNPEIIDVLRENRTIHTINLSDNRLNEEDVVPFMNCFKSNTTIRNLNLSKMNLNLHAFTELCDVLRTNSTLTTLNISHNKMNDEKLQQLGRGLVFNNSIHTLHMNGIHFDVSRMVLLVKILRYATKIHTLSLNDCILTNKLLIILLSVSTIHNLSFNGCWTLRITRELVDAFETNTTLNVLSLRNIHLVDNSASRLYDILVRNTSIHTLDISHNEINDFAASRIASAIERNTIMEVLLMKNVKISRRGIQEIKDSRRNFNTTLRELTIT